MKNKIFWISLLLLIMQGKVFLFSQNLMHYTSGEYKYSILIPEDWKRTDEVKSAQISLVMISGKGASVNVSFYALKNLKEEEFISQFEKSLPGQLEGVMIEEKGSIKSRDDEAVYLIYDFLKDGQDYREKVCFYSRNKEIALVTASMLKEDFNMSLDVFNKIFQSFTFETDQERVEAKD